MLRCEIEVLPTDGEMSATDLYDAASSAGSLRGLSCCGWRTEPLFFGIEKLILVARLDCISVDAVLCALRGVEGASYHTCREGSSRLTDTRQPFAFG